MSEFNSAIEVSHVSCTLMLLKHSRTWEKRKETILAITRPMLEYVYSIYIYIYMFISYSHGMLLYYDKHDYEYTQ